jgi:hypothetical protein
MMKPSRTTAASASGAVRVRPTALRWPSASKR